MNTMRHLTFRPSFICLLSSIYSTTVESARFIVATSALNSLILSNFAWLINSGVVFLVGVCAPAESSFAQPLALGNS